jgi:aminoglycoside 2'-N-acetyltransferase I
MATVRRMDGALLQRPIGSSLYAGGDTMGEPSTAAGRRDNLSVVVVPTAALDAATRAAIIALCNRAFAHDPAHDFTTLFDFVTGSMHVLAYEGDVLVAHACWADRWIQPEGLPPLRTAYVDAVATQPARQGRGIGAAVMERLAREAAGYQLQALSTDSAAGFYERLGWERWQGPTAGRTPEGLRPTPDVVVLIRRTATTPTLDLTARLIADDRGGQPW